MGEGGGTEAKRRRGGGVRGVLAAGAVGVTTALVQRFAKTADPIPTAMMLYTGAAVVSLRRSIHREHEAPVRSAHVMRLILVALLGAVFSPVCLVWGRQHPSGPSSSLLLNCEAEFAQFTVDEFLLSLS